MKARANRGSGVVGQSKGLAVHFTGAVRLWAKPIWRLPLLTICTSVATMSCLRPFPICLDYLRVRLSIHVLMRDFDKRFHEIANVPFLVLDDLRMASATPWAKEKLFQIIDYRYLSRMPTVITSSETVEETDKRLATRLLDRRLCKIFALEARSYVKRMKKHF